MGAGEVPPGRDQPLGVELVRHSERTRVTRVHLPRGTVVRKEPLGPDAERRLRHELAMLERLRGTEGVAQLAQTPQYPGSIVLRDAGRRTVAELPKPLSAHELIRLALALGGAVARMHGRGVMHRDISPANIMLSAGGEPCLVSFAVATSLGELRPEFMPQSQITGTLAYLAPESTGRTGRPVDQRADLYALGATLYELATGEPPFGSGDPLRLIHDHLARVPVPPAEANREIRGSFSDIVMHLLEKEPDNRYQTAEGLVYDLQQLRALDTGRFRVGRRDAPLRLAPPSRLIGREAELSALERTFSEALSGRSRGVLVSGAPGVGKTALVDQLRPVMTASEGWFVAGKFDQYQRDQEFDAVYQAFRALGRFLLAEPEDRLTRLRTRIREALGPNAGLATALLPEFAALLAVPAEPGDPMTAQLRTQRAGLDVLRTVASPERPLVMFVDDLQWAGGTQLGFIDLMLREDPIEGLLLVAAYREDEVDAAHPLAAPLSRWREHSGVRHVWLQDLPAPDLASMVAEILRVEPAAAAGLAEAIAPHTHGNPYQTVELLNALRSEGLLSMGASGWQWTDAAVRRRLGSSDVGRMLAGRAKSLPTPSRQLLETMACLGGRAELGAVQTAIGEPADVIEQHLAPALAEGILVAEPGMRPAVRFRHDRLREVILRNVDLQSRHSLQLAMARRLAQEPERFAIAAEQYLDVVDLVDDSAERRQVVEIFQRAADQAKLSGDYARIEGLLAAALRLIDPGERALIAEARTNRHAALYGLGRHEEADEEYGRIMKLCPAAIERADATAMQVRSLTHRNRLSEAFALGVDSLRELGITLPGEDRLQSELDRHFHHLYRWLRQTSLADDLERGEITDPALLAAATLINAVEPTAFFASGPAATSWIGLEAVRICHDHAPSRRLLGPAIHAGFAALALRGDYDAAYETARRILALGEARGYEPEASEARYLYGCVSQWFEPIEDCVATLRLAREKLIAGGEHSLAAFTYRNALGQLFDSAPLLESSLAEVETGLALARRTGNDQSHEWLDSYGRLIAVLRDRSSAGLNESVLSETAANPAKLVVELANHSIAAAIFGDVAALSRHTAAAMPLLAGEIGYHKAQGHILRGLALVAQARAADGPERDGYLAELDRVMEWLADRAADAPENFSPVLRLLEAERAWAVADFQAAALAFDAARREVAQLQRPWHRALILEHAARFYLTSGLDVAGHELLREARREYLEWGATAKVNQLDWAYSTLHAQSDAAADDGSNAADLSERSPVTTGTIDLLGILSASQALSSEISIEQLRSRLVQVLGSMTGATSVHLLLWSEERQHWLLLSSGGGGEALAAASGNDSRAPMSVLRYVQRTREPLVVADAARDDRFARDPYFAKVASCSVLTVPVLSRGALRAMLLLENRLMRGAFTAERLDAARLIAGQLAVSLDNAQLYAELAASRARILAAADQARRRIERDLHDGAQQRLITIALRLRAAEASVPPTFGPLRAELGGAVAGLNDVLEELRDIARGIHPSVLTEGGLGVALETLAWRSPVPVSLDIGVAGRLPEQVEITAYYVVAEALTNAAKHANASAVTVAVQAAEGLLRVSVRDDGTGGADLSRGTGLAGLKDRVEALGGLLVWDSPRGAGTSLRAELPLIAANGDIPAIHPHGPDSVRGGKT